jgi:hypothetical protein
MRTGAFLLVLLLFAEDDYAEQAHVFCGEDDVVFPGERNEKKSCLLPLSQPAKYNNNNNNNNNNNKLTTIHRQRYSIITTERDKVKEATHRVDYY